MKLSELASKHKEPTPNTDNTGTQTLEVEYSFIAKVDRHALLSQLYNDPEVTSEYMIEGNITSDPSTGKLRVRHWPSNDRPSVTKLEQKIKVELNKAIETSVDIPEAMLKPLISVCKDVTARVRFYVPVKRPDGSVVKRIDDTVMQWQVDFFLLGFDPELKATPESFSEWVKIEVEVDNDTLSATQVANNIPFETQELLDARSKDESTRNIIDTLYGAVYNLVGRSQFEKPQSTDTVPTSANADGGGDKAVSTDIRAGSGESGSDESEDDHDFEKHLQLEGDANKAPEDAGATATQTETPETKKEEDEFTFEG